MGKPVTAYGDTTGDGMVQLSFTLPLPAGPRTDGAAHLFANRMGIEPAMVVHSKPMGPGHTFFIVYGRARVWVDPDEVEVAERPYPLLSAKEVDATIRAGLGRPLVVLGACIGTDAHTVGIDAILSLKGFAGEKGLESHREMRVVNLGAQVAIDDLVRIAQTEQADAVLVSQVVTQRDAHLTNTTALARAFDAAYADGPRPFPPGPLAGSRRPVSSGPLAGSRRPVSSGPLAGSRRPLLVVGGPRFEPAQAALLGVDRVFGRGTTPGDVASYLVHALVPQHATPAPVR